MSKMIFHTPYALNKNATSASGIRPVKMRDAFEAEGFEVFEITGDFKERRKRIKKLKKLLAEGTRFDFCYSESATVPTSLAGSKRLPPHPFLDLNFLGYLIKKGIPAGVFYRDIYWRFGSYKNIVKAPFRQILKTLYMWDLYLYKKFNITIFLPSIEMSKWVPVLEDSNLFEMPPGCEVADKNGATRKAPNREITLFYVGGINDYYRMHKTVQAVADTDGVKMILCTRKDEWEKFREDYDPLLNSKIEIVHEHGAALKPLYDKSDLGVLLFESMTYREFAVPMKLFEYIGMGKPVVATNGSFAARFITENQLGWALDYEEKSIKEFLDWILTNPDEYEKVRQNVLQTRTNHTWRARALQIAQILSNSTTN